MVVTVGRADGQMPEWARSLHATLLVEVPSLQGLPTRAAVTKQLTAVLRSWALSEGWRSQLEVPVDAHRETTNGRRMRGYVDVVVHRPTQPDVAMELDRHDKGWSLEKLLAASRGGYDTAWLRWGTRPCELDVPAPVVLFNLPIRYQGRPTARATPESTTVHPAPAGRPLTIDEIEAAKTPAGGWTRAQLAEWGVPWPPPHGWKRQLTDNWHPVAREAR